VVPAKQLANTIVVKDPVVRAIAVTAKYSDDLGVWLYFTFGIYTECNEDVIAKMHAAARAACS